MRPWRDGSKVNWDVISEELQSVVKEFRDPKFYSLRTVVEILSAQDPQGLKDEVSCRCRRVLLPGAVWLGRRAAVSWELTIEHEQMVGDPDAIGVVVVRSGASQLRASQNAEHGATLCLTQLKEQQERLEILVDQVVQGYHGGFARSIQNYSQILHLFSEAKEQVGGCPAWRSLGRRRVVYCCLGGCRVVAVPCGCSAVWLQCGCSVVAVQFSICSHAKW